MDQLLYGAHPKSDCAVMLRQELVRDNFLAKEFN